MDLEIDHDEAFQVREWRWVRVGWLAMIAFVLAGLVGLLGPGPFSWVSAKGEHGLVTVEYQRISHNEADDSITLQFSARSPRDGQLSVELSGPWVSGVNLQNVSPQPAEQRIVQDGIRFVLPADDSVPSAVQLTFRPQKYGSLDGTVAVGGDRVAFSQFVIP